MKRHELTDDQWALLSEFFPPRVPKPGGQWKDDRMILNGVFWRLNIGAPWRDLPERYGPWQTVYDRFSDLRKSGLLDRIIERLQLRLNEAGFIDSELFCIDGTNVRAARAAAGAAKKIPRLVSRPTTRWGAVAGASEPRYTWSPTATGCPWPSRSQRVKPTRVPRSRG
jgi:transposase